MASFNSSDCLLIMNELLSNPSCNCINKDRVNRLYYYCTTLDESKTKEEVEEGYAKPLVWIGIYIAAASLFCTFAMVADLLHGFRKRKLWFPCKYFTLNAASITIIAIAMKLPVDLNSPMPGAVDQITKIGSMVFMCTMMANFMPSLASMSNKGLFANVIGLVILIVTLIVNVLIQLQTGLLEVYFFPWEMNMSVGMTFSVLVMLISLAITIPTSKQILEFKYQAAHKSASNDKHPQHTRTPTIGELTQHVIRYWVMAGTSSPQFVMACTSLCSAAGIICCCNVATYFYILVIAYLDNDYKSYGSDYKWSMLMILIIQSIGVAVGIIAPIFRCFAALSFKLSIKWSRNHIKVFKVEKYWTQKLSEWKQIRLAFPLGGRRSKALVNNSKNLILNLCIGFQMVVVVLSKMMGLIPIGMVIFVVYCIYCWKLLKTKLFDMPTGSHRYIKQEIVQNDKNEDDISNYVLQLQDEMELGKRTLKSISKSVDRLIQNAEKHVPNNLLKLLEKSVGFKGVENESDQVQPLLSVEHPYSWSLQIVTLTCITISLPNIRKDRVDSLFRSVGEGLPYTHLVEENLNHVGESINIQRATMNLWHEVEVNNKWLENTLGTNISEGKTSTDILKWFTDKAKEIVEEINTSTHGEIVDNFSSKLIVANSMYHIAQTIIVNYQSNIEQNCEEDLFAILSGMIADIFVACLTNLPRVILLKCHESVIEKREASVEAAAKLLGRSVQIIKRLQKPELPSLDPDQMPFIDKWGVHLKQSTSKTSLPSIGCQGKELVGPSSSKGEEKV